MPIAGGAFTRTELARALRDPSLNQIVSRLPLLPVRDE